MKLLVDEALQDAVAHRLATAGHEAPPRSGSSAWQGTPTTR